MTTEQKFLARVEAFLATVEAFRPHDQTPVPISSTESEKSAPAQPIQPSVYNSSFWKPTGFGIRGIPLDEFHFDAIDDGFGIPEALTELEPEPEPQRRPAVTSGDNKTLERAISSLDPVVKPVSRRIPAFTSPGSAGKTGRTPQDLRDVQGEWYGWQPQCNFKKRNAQQMLSSSSSESGSYSEESGSYSEESGSYSGESDR